jgi:hypothetical protein
MAEEVNVMKIGSFNEQASIQGGDGWVRKAERVAQTPFDGSGLIRSRWVVTVAFATAFLPLAYPVRGESLMGCLP